jgi:cytochrome c oxidase subunit 2
MSDHMTTTIMTLGESWMHRIWFRSPAASAQAAETDWLYMFIMWTCVIAFLVLLVPILWFPFKYHRSKQGKNYVQSPAHHTVLELTWSIVPLIVMVFMFFWGFQGYVAKLAAPSDAEEITIRGMKWNWTPIYRNGAGTDATARMTDTKTDVPIIYVPAGRPVKLLMASTDVIHSFYIPDFRTKMDVFPNRYTSMWFHPLEPSTPGPGGKWVNDDKNSPDFGKAYPGAGHWVFCAEYCGTQHSEMGALMVVLPPEAYEKKVYELATKFPEGTWAQVGEQISKRKGCLQCHSVDGSKNTGPTWKDMYGETHKYTDGSTAVVDDNVLREGILYSQKKILDGYAGQNMPVFAGQINDNELLGVISYIKTLSTKTGKADLDKANTLPDLSSGDSKK